MSPPRPGFEAWFRTWGGPPAPTGALVCFPPAGSGAGLFRPLHEQLGDELTVVGVQLPGREARWREWPATDLAALAEELAAALTAWTSAPVALLGHSMGALLAFEVASRLTRDGVDPLVTIVSAVRPPHLFVSGRDGAATSDDQIARHVERRLVERGLDPSKEVIELMASQMRADVQLCASYDPAPGVRLRSPLVAWRGSDDPGVTGEHVEEWRRYATSPVVVESFAGGHDFHVGAAPEIAAAVRRAVAVARRGDRGRALAADA